MGTLLFGALLFQIKFKIVLKEYTSNPRMCVAVYFVVCFVLFKLSYSKWRPHLSTNIVV